MICRRASAVAVAALALGCGEPRTPAVASSPGAPAIAIVGVTVLLLDTAATLPDQTVIVRGERIERVGPSGAVPVPAGARVIDGRGRFVMPGLMDMHVHLARTQDLALLLAHGVTTVRNMWGAPIHLEWRDRIARGELRGPTIVTAGPILDGENPVHPGSLIVRTAADADRAIELHRRLGYDFVKVYSKLSPEAFDRIAADATRAGLAVAGHVPRGVPLEHAVDAGMRSIEHMTGFIAALQAADSPLAGRTDGPSRARQIDHVDESRIAALVGKVAAHRVFDVPTLSVMDSWRGAAEVRERLAGREMRWLPPCERVLAEPGPDDPEDLERSRRTLALYGRVIRALDQAGAPIVAGTDPQNPLVVPGFSLHHELELLVDAGLSPLSALQSATRRAAELLGRSGELGGVAPGMRADLVLLDGNPLEDIHNTRRIAGVMARGRWLAAGELTASLEQIATELAGPEDPFRGAPALAVDGEPVVRLAFDITWQGVWFGGERLAIAGRGDALSASFESFDAHTGETTRARWREGGPSGASLTLDLDGATGRGHLEVRRDAGQVHARGTSLPGVEAAFDHPIAPDALLAPEGVLSSVVLLTPRLARLEVGQSIELHEQAIGLGSEAEWSERSLQIRRAADRPWEMNGVRISARAYEISVPRGGPIELLVDADGWPLEMMSQDHGARLVLRRRAAPR